jgi:4'-phosphopantetheinyl transferase EntD
VAKDHDVLALGIDAEVHAPLPHGVLDLISTTSERTRLAEIDRQDPLLHWDRVLFSIKESVFKAWYPFTGTWAEATHIQIELDPPRETFAANIKVPTPAPSGVRATFPGRFLIEDDLVFTATFLQ